MSTLGEIELREAIAIAERRVAALRVSVAIARLDADPVRRRRRSIAWLVAIGAVGLIGSVTWGRHLTSEASEHADRLVLHARDEEILVDRHAFDECTTTRGKIAARLAECTREVATLEPHTRARVADACMCERGDPLCACQ